jgi:hypothetical protein
MENIPKKVEELFVSYFALKIAGALKKSSRIRAFLMA